MEIAKYYKCSNFELGALSTGKQSSNYEAWMTIYNKNGAEMQHELTARAYGKWHKVHGFIKRYTKKAEKIGLKEMPPF